ncbi:phosphotransferase [Fibrella sp. WM1]|uniref:phosphotransferase n=1 Tax=Fibrella musci TaxID=3242485 RepID=UPI0035200583
MHLDAQHPTELQTYLIRNGWLCDDETIVALSKPGEGNMNYTLRVQTNTRSLIVKQARGYVEKYPSIAAPTERAVIEGRFYQRIATNPQLAQAMPALLGMDEGESVLVLDDLGTSSDYTWLYKQASKIHAEDATTLVGYLSLLHAQFQTNKPDSAFTNEAMRRLNYEHIFSYPFLEENGFDLDTVQPGLQDAALPYKQNEALKEAARTLGERYVGEAPAGTLVTLLHGDFYPGSWLQTAHGVRVIDPEFCFYGPAEFDLGVMLAHMHMARQGADLIRLVRTGYVRHEGFDERLLNQFTGIEILRRLIGLAQLPLTLSLGEKVALLALGEQLVLA